MRISLCAKALLTLVLFKPIRINSYPVNKIQIWEALRLKIAGYIDNVIRLVI